MPGKPYGRRCKPAQASPSEAKESTFQSRVIQCARLNGWQITVADTREGSPLYQHLYRWFRGKMKKVLDFLLARRRQDFLLVYHTHDSRLSAPGFPDLVLVHPTNGRLLFCELKQEGKYPTTEQRLWLSALSRVAEENPLVEVHLWKPSSWSEIVETLGGMDSRLFL